MIDVETIGVGVDTKDVAKANKDLDSFGKSADNASRRADGTTKSMSDMAGMATRLLGVIGVAGLGGAAIRAADEFTKLTAQLKIASRNQDDFNKSYSEVIRISNGAQTSINGTATLYARLANTLKETNVTQQQFSQITESVALGLRVSGAGAQEAQSAMLQLSQAFASGVLRGEEFNAVSEASFPLMNALAKSMGIPIEQLRTMAHEGKITRDELVKAFADQKLIDSFRAQSKEMNTVSGALTNVKNSLLVATGQFDKATGFSNFLASALNGVSIALDGITAAANNVPFDAITRLLPAYAAYKKQLDSENKSLAIGGTQGSIIPRGLRMDEIARTDIGKLGEVSEEFKKIQASYAEFAKTNPLNDAISKSKEYANSLALLADAESKGIISMQEAQRYRAQLREEFDKSNKTSKKAAEDAIKREEEVRKYMFNLEKELDDEVTKRYNQAVKIREKDDKEEFERKTKMVDALQKQATENYKEAQKETEKQSQALEKEYERINETISRGLSDALMRGFESGKSFAENFKDTLKNMFQTLILKPVIEMAISRSGIASLMGGVGSLFSGGASAGLVDSSLSGGGNIFSGGLDLVKGITKGFDGINMTFQSSIEKLGAYISTGNGGIADAIGGALGQYSSQISSVLGYGGAALAGIGFLKSGNYAGAALTGVGAALGGPIGGAIGAALGSLFGGKVKTQKSSMGVTGSLSGGQFTSSNQSGLAGYGNSLGGQEGLASVMKAYSQVVNQLFSAFGMGGDVNTSASLFQRQSKKTRAWGYFGASIGDASVGFGTGNDPFGSAQAAMEALVNKIMTEGITGLVAASKLPEGIRMLFEGLGDKESIQAMIQASINLGDAQDVLNKRFGLTADTAGKVAIQSGYAGTELAKFANLLATSALATQKMSLTIIKERDALTDLIGSLPNSVDAFDAVLKSINTTTAEGQREFAELFQLRERFASFTGGFDSIISNVESAIYGMVSPSEKLALDQANLAKAFAELNLTVPNSIADLIALGKGIDYSTEAGLDLALAFPALVEMFGKTEDAVNSLSGTLNNSYFSTRADMLSANASDNPRAFVKGQVETNAELLLQIKQMKTDNADMKAIMAAVVEYTRQQQRIIDDWDVNGMPAERVA